MINEKNISEMIRLYVKNGEVLTNELNQLGLISNDITNMVHNTKALERVKRGEYRVNSQLLYTHASKLYENGELEETFKILHRCYLDDKENINLVYNIFLLSILLKDYTVTFECLEKLYQTNSKLYTKEELNFYLYLLSNCTSIPKEYHELLNSMEFKDIKEERTTDNPQINELRSLAFNSTFTKAYLLANMHSSDLKDKVTNLLLKTITQIRNEEKGKIKEIIKIKDYEGLIRYLNEDLGYRGLTDIENYVGILASDIIEIKKSRIVLPIEEPFTTEKNAFGAINNRKYKLAMELQEEHSRNKNIKIENDLIYLLLKDINELVYQIRKENKKSTSQETEPSKEPEKNKEIEDMPETILTILLSGEIEEALKTVERYLSSIYTLEYKYLINYLIKLSIIENDKTFNKPMMVISLLKNGSFKFSISEYILSYYENLAKKNFDAAEIYLNIIDKAVELGQTTLAIKGMREVLENAKENEKQLSFRGHDYTKRENNYRFEDLKIGYSLDDLKERGILLIDTKEINIDKIKKIAETLSNVEISIINNEFGEKVLFRYKEATELMSEEQLNKLLNEASIEYYKENYSRSLALYKNYLSVTPAINTTLLSRIALLFTKVNNIDVATDYLLVANSFAKLEDIDIDYIGLIETLKNEKIVSKDNKIAPNSKQQEIKHKIDLKIIIKLITEENKNLKDACDILGLNDDDYLKCALLVAREYYYIGDYTSGDQYYNLVVKTKGKNEEVKRLMQEISTNKMFYKNRENTKKLLKR